MIPISPAAIARLAEAIDFHLPHGWSDELGRKVVDVAPTRLGRSSVLTLRDRFASAAMQGVGYWGGDVNVSEYAAGRLAKSAYLIADAMIAAREPNESPSHKPIQNRHRSAAFAVLAKSRNFEIWWREESLHRNAPGLFAGEGDPDHLNQLDALNKFAQQIADLDPTEGT